MRTASPIRRRVRRLIETRIEIPMVFACYECMMRATADEDGIPPLVAVNPARAGAAVRCDSARLVNVSDPAELTSEKLAERAQAGCRESFEQLVSRYEQPIFNFLRQFTRNHHDAEDLTQETFVKAYRSLERYRPSLSFAPWLFTIARRTAASHFRSAVRVEELPAEEGVVEENPANLLASKDEQNSIWRLARILKPKQCEVLWLHYGEGFSVAETARIMRTGQIHVRVLLHRARANLSRLLANRAAGPTNSAHRSAKKLDAVPPAEKKGFL